MKGQNMKKKKKKKTHTLRVKSVLQPNMLLNMINENRAKMKSNNLKCNAS